MTDLGTSTWTPQAGASSPDDNSSGVKEKADELKGRAQDTKDTAMQAGAEVAQTATQKAQEVAGETKRQAQNLAQQSREQLQGQLQQQHQNLVGQLRTLADQLSSMAGQQDAAGGVAGQVVGQAGDRAHQLAGWLENRQPSDVVEEVRRYARQHPGTFLLGAAAAGVVAARLTRGVVAARQADSGSSSEATTTSLPAVQSDYGTTTTYGDTAVHPTPGPDLYPNTAAEVGVGYTPTTPNYGTVPDVPATGYSTPTTGQGVAQYPGGAGYHPGGTR